MGKITCINGVTSKKEKDKVGEFISPMLNISKAQTPIYVQFYINTVLQRIVCIRDVNKIISCFNNLTYTLHKYPGIPVTWKFSQFST